MRSASPRYRHDNDYLGNHAWSKELPAWQQDAIARLYQDRTLGATDLDEFCALGMG